MVTMTNLGIDSAGLVPQSTTSESSWVTGQPFIPTVGKCYEVNFGRIRFRGDEGHASARIRIDSHTTAGWFDLDEQRSLDPDLSRCVVQAFRIIEVK